MKLLGAASYRSFRCLWMLEELSIPYDYEPVQPQSKKVLKYNPLGKVPVLIEDGFSLYESCAINTYLGDKYCSESLRLVPECGSRQRGLYDQTVSVLISELDAQGLWIHRKHEAHGRYFSFVPDAVTHARKYFNKTNRTLMKQLEHGGPYLLGNDFTAADIIYVHCLEWSSDIKWDDKWKQNSNKEDLFSGVDRKSGKVLWTGTRADLIFGSNSQLRALAEV